MDISDLAEAYKEAENAISLAEKHTLMMPEPALNEMRYAGSHAVSCMLAKDKDTFQQELTAAIMHCRRAHFDAQSVLLLYLFNKVKNIREGLGVYLHFFPEMVGSEYDKLKGDLIPALGFIETVSSVKEDTMRWEKRGELNNACQPHIKACSAYINAYERIEEELCSKVDDAKRCDESEKRRARKATILTYVGLGLTLLNIILAIILATCSPGAR